MCIHVKKGHAIVHVVLTKQNFATTAIKLCRTWLANLLVATIRKFNAKTFMNLRSAEGGANLMRASITLAPT